MGASGAGASGGGGRREARRPSNSYPGTPSQTGKARWGPVSPEDQDSSPARAPEA